jgi:hypothetical protein
MNRIRRSNPSSDGLETIGKVAYMQNIPGELRLWVRRLEIGHDDLLVFHLGDMGLG